MTPALAEAAARAVEARGGTLEDVDDLLDVWRRVAAASERRAAAILSAATRCPCTCSDGGLQGDAGRCERCWGQLP